MSNATATAQAQESQFRADMAKFKTLASDLAGTLGIDALPALATALLREWQSEINAQDKVMCAAGMLCMKITDKDDSTQQQSTGFLEGPAALIPLLAAGMFGNIPPALIEIAKNDDTPLNLRLRILQLGMQTVKDPE